MPMTVIMTAMVRDEADLIGPMIEHHLAQGVEKLIITDNGSTDGTRDILQEFSDRGVVDLRDDPVHRKQQSPTVTRMARDAYTLYGAHWVLNADADEFWLPVDRRQTLGEVFAQMDTTLVSFQVPVVDMTGAPALRGSGLSRLRFRDLRPLEAIQEVGLHAHSTPDAVHVGDPHIEVVQGNHFVSLESQGSPPPALAIEVLHFPWRSWEQFSRKVENAGRAYEANPDLTPSPNHHGMRDWRRWKDGTLFDWYLARHPSSSAIEAGLADGSLVEDARLAQIPDPVPDEPVSQKALRRSTLLISGIGSRERTILQMTDDLRDQRERTRHAEAVAADLRRRLEDVESDLATIRRRRVVRFADRTARIFRG